MHSLTYDLYGTGTPLLSLQCGGPGKLKNCKRSGPFFLGGGIYPLPPPCLYFKRYFLVQNLNSVIKQMTVIDYQIQATFIIMLILKAIDST